MPTRIFLLDDHEVVRRGLRELLEAEDDLTVVGEAGTAEEALMRLTEAYMALGIVNEAETAAAVLGHNFPDSKWYSHAYSLLGQNGAQPQEHEGS